MDKTQYIFQLPEPSPFVELRAIRSEDGICYHIECTRKMFIRGQNQYSGRFQEWVYRENMF